VKLSSGFVYIGLPNVVKSLHYWIQSSVSSYYVIICPRRLRTAASKIMVPEFSSVACTADVV